MRLLYMLKFCGGVDNLVIYKLALSYFFFLDKFVLKTWISRRVFYFVGILSGVRDIFLLDCPQIFFLINLRFRGISEPHKSLVQRGEFFYKFSRVCLTCEREREREREGSKSVAIHNA